MQETHGRKLSSAERVQQLEEMKSLEEQSCERLAVEHNVGIWTPRFSLLTRVKSVRTSNPFRNPPVYYRNPTISDLT